VGERSLWAATEVSYEKAAEFLKRFAGLEVTHKKIRPDGIRRRQKDRGLRRREAK